MKIRKENIDNIEVLLVDDIPQSVYPPQGGYWQHMIPEGKIDSALILGVAGGTICRLLIDKNPDIEITAVDNSKKVIDYANKHFNLKEINMKLIIRDAFEFIYQTPERYDYICVDIWNGHYFPFTVLMPPFVDRCKTLLKPGGMLYINTPNLDYFALENLKEGERDDIGRNLIYRWKKGGEK